MAMFGIKYIVKPSTIGDPKVYLWADVGKLLYGNSYYACTMRSGFYFKVAIKNVKKRLKEDGI